MQQPQVDYEALKVRQERHDDLSRAAKKRERLGNDKVSRELRMVAHKLGALSSRVENLGQPDLAEDLRTCQKFARMHANKAAQ